MEPVVYKLNYPEGKPDDLVFKHDDVINFFMKLRQSQNDHSWQGGTLRSPRRWLRHAWNRLRHWGHLENNVVDVDAVLLRMNPGKDEFNTDEVWSAARMLWELSRSAVPRIVDTSGHRYMFFNVDHELNTYFPQLNVIWSADNKVAVYYAWGGAEVFHKWAFTYHPDLVPKLERLAYRVIVVVPRICKITPEMLASFEAERSKIWKYFI